MSTSLESSAQYERDLRRTSKDVKRYKDAAVKWSYGARPGAGVKSPLSDDPKAKIRPLRKNSEM